MTIGLNKPPCEQAGHNDNYKNSNRFFHVMKFPFICGYQRSVVSSQQSVVSVSNVCDTINE